MDDGVDIIKVAAEFVQVRDIRDDRLSIGVILDVEARELVFIRIPELVDDRTPDRAVRSRNEDVYTGEGGKTSIKYLWALVTSSFRLIACRRSHRRRDDSLWTDIHEYSLCVPRVRLLANAPDR